MITSQKASSPDREALSATSARHPRPGSESGAGSSGDPAVLGHSRAGGRHPRPGSESGAGSSGDQRLVVIPAQAGIQASSLFPRSRLKPSVRPLLFFLLLPQLGPCGLERFESLLLRQHPTATLTPSPTGRGWGEGRHSRASGNPGVFSLSRLAVETVCPLWPPVLQTSPLTVALRCAASRVLRKGVIASPASSGPRPQPRAPASCGARGGTPANLTGSRLRICTWPNTNLSFGRTTTLQSAAA